MPQTREDFLRQLGRNPADPLTDYPSPWTSRPPAVPWQWQYAKPGPYITQLNPQQETQFQQWVQNYRSPSDPAYRIPFDPSPTADYDMRGYWLALQQRDPRAVQSVNPNDRKLHFPDIWKTPYHQSFSSESMYATPNAPQWINDHQLADQTGRVLFDELAQVKPLESRPTATPTSAPSPLWSQQQKLLPTPQELLRNTQLPPPGTVQGVIPPGAQIRPTGPTFSTLPQIRPPSPLERLQGAGMNYEPVRRAHQALDVAGPLLESATDIGNITPGGEGFLTAAGPLSAAAQKEGLLRSFDRMSQYMKPEIAESLSKRIRVSIAAAFKGLPSAEEYEAAARAGIAKRGWYRNSGQVIRGLYGDDTPVFTGILAAQSPRQLVQSNLKMAIQTFGEWDAAGRPTDARGILKVLKKVPGATLPSRVPNTIKAMRGEPLVDFIDPASGNGYKVESFRRNLLGEMDWTTLDTWMAKFAGKMGNFFGNRANYLANDARIRQVAERMGPDWTPAEVQETVWSWLKTLVEQTPRSSTLQKGLKGITHELIAQDPDFATLFRDPDVVRRLSQYGITVPPPESGAAPKTILGGEEAPDPRVLSRIVRRLQREGIKPVGKAVKGAKPP